MQENIDKIENVIDTYEDGKFTVIVSYDPNGRSFQEAALEYFQRCLDKELGE